ncbi:MAG: hypothetical protein EPO68_18025 [Planctomycetota bacterium]|nr:MAG: hypothetical protein EPO68_18025 [Planctomycetota bacterium]
MNSLSSLLLLAVPLALQQPAAEDPKPLAQIPYVQGKATRVKAEEVMLTYYRTRTHANNVTNALLGIYDSSIRVMRDDGQENQVQRWLTVDDHVLMIRDTAENARKIIATALEMEDLLEPPVKEAGTQPWRRIVQIEYRPRALSAGATLQALAPYQRVLTAPAPPGGNGEWLKSDAIHHVPERNVLVIRDLPERIEEIRQYLARIDVPAAQVDLACWILRGKDAGESSKSLPQDLVANLAKLVPSTAFELAASSMLRASIAEPMKLESTLADRSTYRLTLAPAAFDEQRGELALSSFSFEFVTPPRGENAAPSSNGFQGAATLRANEYTVLGAVGETPLYVVLRVNPSK